MNPYAGKDFFGFFSLLISRIWLAITEGLPLSEWASDEVQLAALVLLGISSSLLGTFLVLKKMTMVANALSHTVLLGIVVCYLLFPNKNEILQGNFFFFLLAALITAILTTFTTQFFTKTLRLQEQASIGLVFTFFFSLAILLVSLFARNVHLGVEAVMGNVDALHIQDVKILGILTVVTSLSILRFYRGFTLSAFDTTLAVHLGFSPAFYHYLLMFLLSLNLVGAFRAVGVLLVIGFLVIPYLTMRLWCFRMSHLLVYSSLFTVASSCGGIALSRHLLSIYQMPVSTAGLVVSLMALGYGVSLAFKEIGKKWALSYPTASGEKI